MMMATASAAATSAASVASSVMMASEFLMDHLILLGVVEAKVDAL